MGSSIDTIHSLNYLSKVKDILTNLDIVTLHIATKRKSNDNFEFP